MFLFLAGYSLLKEPKIKVVTETKVVEKPVAYRPTIIIGNDLPESGMRQEAKARIGEMVGSTSTSPSIFNYVIFREMPFNEDGFANVVVGMQYSEAEDRVPSSQWCYVEKDHGTIGIAWRFDLANKTGSVRQDSDFTDRHASDLGTTRSVLARAQAQCVFR